MDAITNRTAWLDARRKGIGGSDVAPILGLSPWRTPLDVFRDKRGELVDATENDAMRWGNILEPVVRQEYSNVTGRDVLLADGMLAHERHSFMLANLDGFTPDGRIYEGKTARSANGWGEPGTDEVPQAYLFQVQHYMAITGYPVADIAVLIGGSDFRIYTVEADRELHDMLVTAEAAFWQHVQNNEPPEPVSLADALAMWGNASVSRSVQATPEMVAAVVEMRNLKAQIAELDARADERKAEIMIALGEADTLVDFNGTPLVTWKAGKPPGRFDAKTFKVAHPELYAAFAATGEPTRRFLLK